MRGIFFDNGHSISECATRILIHDMKSNLDLANIKIETERLLLLPQEMKNAEVVFNEFTHEITTYMTPPTPKEIEETKEYIRRAEKELRAGTDLHVAIFKRDTMEFLGGGGVNDITTAHPRFGIWIKKSAHGNKYGQEAIHGLYDWVNEHLDFEYIVYPVVAENIPSRKIAELLGGHVEKEYEKTMGSGKTYITVEYHIPPESAKQ